MMKSIIKYGILLWVSVLAQAVAKAQDEAEAPASPDPTKPHQLWGGKWTDYWEVFLRIYPAEEAGDGSFPVQYIFRANPGQPLRTQVKTGKVMPSGYTRAGFLYFRLPAGDDPQRGVLFGDFKNDLMANMVRIDPPVLDLEDFGKVAPQWREGAIEAEEARKIVLGAEAELLGSPAGGASKADNSAAMVVSDAEILQAAKELWAKKTSAITTPTWGELAPFIHPESSLAKRQGKDLYGREFTLGTSGTKVKVNVETYNGLKDVYPDVWGEFAP